MKDIKIALTHFEWKLLNSYVGQGPIEKASIIFFGNEFGLANTDIQQYLKYIKEAIDTEFYYQFGNHWSKGFTIKEPNVTSGKCTSPFVKLTAQLAMALRANDKNLLNKSIDVNDFVLNKLHKEDTCIFNLRPLPRPSEEDWIYENVNKKSYETSLRFPAKRKIDKSVREQVQNLVRGFQYANKPVIIGTGDKDNKLKFFKKVLPQSSFSEIKLDTGRKVYVDFKQKIILCDYFEYRIFSLNSLKEIFDIITTLGA